jgi:hypothetical protein
MAVIGVRPMARGIDMSTIEHNMIGLAQKTQQMRAR